MIYVVQTIAGREESVARRLSGKRDPRKGRRAKPAADAESAPDVPDPFSEVVAGQQRWETLVPRRKLQFRVKGAWRVEEDVVFPGYVFVVADAAAGIEEAVRATPYAVRLLGAGQDGSLRALAPEEEALVRVLYGEDGEALDVSRGIAEGDRVVVTTGPLVGMESVIKKVDRHKRRAFIDVDLCGRTVTVKVGLEVVEKR